MGQIHLLVYTGAAANFTLQTSGGPISRGGGHPDPDIRGARLKKKIFSAHRASSWSKIKEGTRASPGPSPASATANPFPYIKRHARQQGQRVRR